MSDGQYVPPSSRSLAGNKSASFSEDTLTVRSHLDHDKHWIGEALPPASDAEIVPAGVANSAGNSPFPARADHSHDSITYFSRYSSESLAIPPGRTYISNLIWFAGRNILAPGSQQVLIFPKSGSWEISFSIFLGRDAVGVFNGEVHLIMIYNNGSFERVIDRVTVQDKPDWAVIHAVDKAWYWDVDSSTNVQIAVEHNDTSSWHGYLQWLEIRRLSGIESA